MNLRWRNDLVMRNLSHNLNELKNKVIELHFTAEQYNFYKEQSIDSLHI